MSGAPKCHPSKGFEATKVIISGTGYSYKTRREEIKKRKGNQFIMSGLQYMYNRFH